MAGSAQRAALRLAVFLALLALSLASNKVSRSATAHAPVSWCFKLAKQLPSNYQRFAKTIDSVKVVKSDPHGDELEIVSNANGRTKTVHMKRKFNEKEKTIVSSVSYMLGSVKSVQKFSGSGRSGYTTVSVELELHGMLYFMPNHVARRMFKATLTDSCENFAFFAGANRKLHAQQSIEFLTSNL